MASNMGISESFHAKFKRLYEESGLSKNAFAKRAGLSQSQVSYYLDRVNSPALDQVERIATALGVSPLSLVDPGIPEPVSVSLTPQLRDIFSRLSTLDDGEMRDALESIAVCLSEPASARAKPEDKAE
jgi:transcriptional regulator with XRE-family HTH domain